MARIGWGAVALAGALALAAGLAADGDFDPQAAFRAAVIEERARDYAQALDAFEQILDAAPDYVRAQREAGNCAYFLGRYPLALEHYQAYLAVHPEDGVLRAFIGRLQARVERQAEAEQVTAWGWNVAVGGGGISLGTEDGRDIASGDNPSLVTGPTSVGEPLYFASFGATYGGGVELFGLVGATAKKLGYQSEDGGPSSLLSLSETEVEGGVRYHWRWGRHSLGLGVGLGLGLLGGSYTVQAPDGAQIASVNLSGATFVFDPCAQYEFRFSRHWGILGILGYRFAHYSDVSGLHPTGAYSNLTNPLHYTDGNLVFIDNSGAYLAVGGAYHFGRGI